MQEPECLLNSHLVLSLIFVEDLLVIYTSWSVEAVTKTIMFFCKHTANKYLNIARITIKDKYYR